MHSVRRPSREQAVRQLAEALAALIDPAPEQGVVLEAEPAAMLTVQQVADRLSISRTHAYGLINRREIPSVLMGGAVRVSEDDLDEYVASCRRDRVSDEEFEGVSSFLREVT